MSKKFDAKNQDLIMFDVIKKKLTTIYVPLEYMINIVVKCTLCSENLVFCQMGLLCEG